MLMVLKILFLLNEERKIHKSYLDYGDCEHGKKNNTCYTCSINETYQNNLKNQSNKHKSKLELCDKENQELLNRILVRDKSRKEYENRNR